jgi:hypothetical protein
MSRNCWVPHWCVALCCLMLLGTSDAPEKKTLKVARTDDFEITGEGQNKLPCGNE